MSTRRSPPRICYQLQRKHESQNVQCSSLYHNNRSIILISLYTRWSSKRGLDVWLSIEVLRQEMGIAVIRKWSIGIWILFAGELRLSKNGYALGNCKFSYLLLIFFVSRFRNEVIISSPRLASQKTRTANWKPLRLGYHEIFRTQNALL